MRISDWSSDVCSSDLKRWNSLRTQISLKTLPVLADIERWSAEKALIEEECIGELRDLALDCEDAAARVMKMPGRPHYINPIQRFFIHFGTFPQKYQGNQKGIGKGKIVHVRLEIE